MYYYIRPKRYNFKIYVTFKICQSFPDNRYFNEKLSPNESIPLIDNIGIWYIENKINPLELKIIYIFYKTEFAYDIIISYDEDPIFIFPDNMYTKYLWENKNNIFILPVFEYWLIYEELKIDLTIISGKAK